MAEERGEWAERNARDWRLGKWSVGKRVEINFGRGVYIVLGGSLEYIILLPYVQALVTRRLSRRKENH